MSYNNKHTLWIIDLGLQPYQPVWELQNEIRQLRIQGRVPDIFLMVEHTPVYTIGKNGSELHVIAAPEFLASRGIEVVHVDRGGDVTYHGPGQLVGYPIIDLNARRPSVSWYVSSLEEVFIRALKYWDIEAHRLEGYRGVWVENDKIVAIGVRISHWVTTHGFAFNVNTRLEDYAGIIPCGIFHHGVTSLKKILGREVDFEEAKEVVVKEFADVFDYRNLKNVRLSELQDLLPADVLQKISWLDAGLSLEDEQAGQNLHPEEHNLVVDKKALSEKRGTQS